jgi:integrase
VVVETSSPNADGSRNRIFKTIKGTKKDAEKLLRDTIAEVENQSYVKTNRITLDTFIHDWLELYIKNNVSPTTMEQYVNQVEHYIVPQFGKMYLQDIKNIDIQRWVNSLREKSPLSDKSLSPKSIKNIFLNLSACLDKAVMQELINKNPCENVTLPKLET